MNARCILATLLIFPATLVRAQESPIPKAFPESRYEKMMEESPFVLATPPAAAAEPEAPKWTENLYLSSPSILTRNGVEVPIIFVRRKGDDTDSFKLQGTEDIHEGIQLVKINWSSNPAKITATLKKGTEFHELEQNEAELLAAAPPPNPAIPGNAAPAFRGIRRPGATAPRQVINAATGRAGQPGTNAPQQTIPRPMTSFVPQQAASAARLQKLQNAAAAKTGPQPPAANDRRRIRVISSQPGR